MHQRELGLTTAIYEPFLGKRGLKMVLSRITEQLAMDDTIIIK